MKFQAQTLATIVLNGTRTVATRILKNLYTVILCLTALLAYHGHIIYSFQERLTTPGIFGYKYMASFVYAFGHRLSFLCLGLILLTASDRLSQENKSLFKHISYGVIFSACFYIFQIFMDKETVFSTNDIPILYYYFAIAIGAACSGIVIIKWNVIMNREIERLKKIITMLFKGYYEDLPKSQLLREERFNEYIDFRMNLTEKIVECEQGKC